MKYENLIVESRSGYLIVTINRPKALNALNDATLTELEDVFQPSYMNAAVRSVIITGAGDRAFVAGADIREFSFSSAEENCALSRRGQLLFRAIEKLSIPVIAAVNGFALGGGCELAMACHIRVASENSRFGQPEIDLGLIPGYGGTQRLIRYLGPGKALEFLLTGQQFDAAEAYRLGLVNAVTGEGKSLEKAIQLAELIASKPPLAVEQILNCYNAYYEERDGFMTENTAFGHLMMTADAKEGITAFKEKRKAKFQGK